MGAALWGLCATATGEQVTVNEDGQLHKSQSRQYVTDFARAGIGRDKEGAYVDPKLFPLLLMTSYMSVFKPAPINSFLGVHPFSESRSL